MFVFVTASLLQLLSFSHFLSVVHYHYFPCQEDSLICFSLSSVCMSLCLIVTMLNYLCIFSLSFHHFSLQFSVVYIIYVSHILVIPNSFPLLSFSFSLSSSWWLSVCLSVCHFVFPSLCHYVGNPLFLQPFYASHTFLPAFFLAIYLSVVKSLIGLCVILLSSLFWLPSLSPCLCHALSYETWNWEHEL